MTISDADYKLLWGRAAGICSNPGCREDLTVVLEGKSSYNIGEMAHIIARKPSGPRGQGSGGSNAYENLILLCPNCHTRIDKAPSDYPEDELKNWKADHERKIRGRGNDEKFQSIAALKDAVRRILVENRSIWAIFGPNSPTAKNDPGSNLYSLWNLRKLGTILPNNTKVINLVEANSALLSSEEYESFVAFKNHALAFEQHQYERLDSYPTFPAEFEKRFGR